VKIANPSNLDRPSRGGLSLYTEAQVDLRQSNRKPLRSLLTSHIVFAYLRCPHAQLRHNGLQAHLAARHAVTHIDALYE